MIKFFLFLKTFRLKKIILLFFILQLSPFAICQPNFVVDTILLPGHYVQKVSASRSSDVWIIEDTSSRSIYRIDNSLSIYNHSPAFQTVTNSSFTSILNNDIDNTLVGTTSDYVYHWNNNIISKIYTINGLNDNTINAIIGYPQILFQQNKLVGITANTSFKFYTYDCLSFTTSNSNTQAKFFELARYLNSYSSSTIIEYNLSKYRVNNEDHVTGSDGSNLYDWGSGLYWQNVNTATLFPSPFSTVPRVLIGMDNKLIASYNNTFTNYLSGFKVNKVIKYTYNSNYALVASDSGLYLFNASSSHAYKASFPGNKFKTNDVDISPDGCVWMATDSGLVRLKDVNCNNYKINFSVSDSVLMFNNGCEIKFKTQCTGCAKSWNWSFGDGTNSNTSNPSHIYSQTGTYTINLISGNGNCSSTVTKSISIIVCCDSSNYNFVNLGPDTAICSSSILDAGGCVGCNYLWSTGAATQTIPVNAPGNYSVRLTNHNGCTSYDSINIAVNPFPSLSFNGLANSCCLNSPAIILLASPSGGVFSGNGISGNSFSPNIAGVGGDTITYSYTDGNGCSNSISQTLTVNTIPTVTFSGLALNYCINAVPVNLSGTPIGGAFSGNGVLGNIFNQTNAGAGASAVIYTYTDGNGCNGSDSQQVIVNPLPIVNFTGLSSNYCITASPANITGSPLGGTYSGNGITGNSFNPSLANIGADTITYDFTDANGCSNSASQTANVIPLPAVSISGTLIICSGETESLSASGIGNFLWNTLDTAKTIIIEPINTTNYSVTASNFCGNAVDSITINVNPIPVASISSDTTILLGNSASINAAGGTIYSWIPATGLSCSNCPNPIAAPKSTTAYSVTITDPKGCSITKTITITVNDNFEIFVPDIFSPNGDGQNDILYVRGTGIKELNFVIYDRLGGKIFESNNISKGWDGTYNGSPLNNAVFVYYLSITLFNDKEIKTKGDITLIR